MRAHPLHRPCADHETRLPGLPALLAELAVRALVDEAELTPKPGLADCRGPGAHHDLSVPLLRRSAEALRPVFRSIAEAALGQRPGPALRVRLGAIGRDGEAARLAATRGVNTHRGALWSLGWLVAGAAMAGPRAPARAIAVRAARVLRYGDNEASVPRAETNGQRMLVRYGATGACGEARRGFPHVIAAGLPMLAESRRRSGCETSARLDTLLALMARLEDTCLLHRGGPAALAAARGGARAVLRVGGTARAEGRQTLRRLESELLARHASPGGSADLLAATLFLDRLPRALARCRCARPWYEGDPVWNA